jgi:hypothetical protein
LTRQPLNELRGSELVKVLMRRINFVDAGFDNHAALRHVPAGMAENPIFDVVIAGGGLAGECLARQLKLARPELSVAVVDFEKRPLPEAAFKVGEATSELGAHYFAIKLQLKDYLAGKPTRIRPARFSAHHVVSTGPRPVGKPFARFESGRRRDFAGRFWRGGNFARRK